MQTNTTAGGSHPDLLSAIYKVEVRHEEKIAEEDRKFCQDEQDKLYHSLEQIERWYDLFVEEAKRYTESYRLSYAANGSVKIHEPYRSYNTEELDYTEFEFRPFKSIDEMVRANHQANSAFANRIVRYFNGKYEVCVPMPNVDSETLPMRSRPVYGTYVDWIIEHLGGRSFRDTAEDELIRRFHKLVKPSTWSTIKPELQGDKISFPNIIHFDPFYFELHKQNHIHYNYSCDLASFCSGIAFGSDDTLHGSTRMIISFNEDDVDIKEWYDLATDNATQMKFFKNGRIDVKFKDAQAAKSCYTRLRLHEIEIHKNE